jgi:membrane protein
MKYQQTIKKRYLLFMMILKSSWTEFMEDNAIKLSASLAYYTIFSLAPMLIVIISLTGIFLGKQAVEGQLFEQIRNYVGDAAALQIQSMIGDADVIKEGLKATVIGIVTMLIGATGVFSEIQSSINYMWGIKPKPRRGYLKYLGNRLLSFLILVGMGLVLILSLLVNSIITSFSKRINELFPFFPTEFANSVNSVFIFVILCLLFFVIFKVLPDAIIAWRDAVIGSLFTTILFMIGKWGIGYYLGYISLGSTYGAAASLVIILLWIYYSAIIIYFGAEFTHMYSLHAGKGIVPKSNAIFVQHREVKIKLQKSQLEQQQQQQ